METIGLKLGTLSLSFGEKVMSTAMERAALTLSNGYYRVLEAYYRAIEKSVGFVLKED